MTNRILTSARSLAVLAALSFGLRRRPAGLQPAPEPVRLDAETEDLNDRWMFGEMPHAISSEAYLCGQEMSRVSGALSGLRATLTQITRYGVLADALPIASPMTQLRADDLLFEGEFAAAEPGILPFEDADLFIEGAIAQSKWPVVRETLSRVA